MRIVTTGRLDALLDGLPLARGPVDRWVAVTEGETSTSLADTRRNLPHADEVVTNKGNTVTVFNLGGNKFRLVVAIHYRGARVYIRELLTHVEYDRDKWKDHN